MDPVVHFELPYDDGERITRFYRQAFAWEMRAMGAEMGNYILATTSAKAPPASPGAKPGAIDGGFFERELDSPEQLPSIVISVGDLQASIRKVDEAGGEVLGEPMDIPGVGSYVAFYDSERNRLGMLQPLAMK